jgi:iron complex outermembrane receptor protein
LDKSFGGTLLYGKVSHGYKSGGFLAQAANPADYTFRPEYVTNYELGQKSDFYIGEAPARLDTAIYYTNYTDMQRTGTDVYVSGGQRVLGGAIFNAGKAHIEGLETQFQVRPIAGLNLTANYAWTHGEYDQYTLVNNNLNPMLDCSGQLTPPSNGQNRSGATEHLQCIPFQYVPKHQASLTAHYVLPIDVVGGSLDGSATYSWTDRQYVSSYEMPQTEPNSWLGAYGLLNASLGWMRPIGEKSSVDIRLFGTNLTNRTYRISSSALWNIIYFQSSIYGEPRILGLSVSYSWGR